MEKLAFIGFGEAGQTISRGLLEAKAAQIAAYDILFGSAQQMAADTTTIPIQ